MSKTALIQINEGSYKIRGNDVSVAGLKLTSRSWTVLVNVLRS
jgi:hypothetical protein